MYLWLHRKRLAHVSPFEWLGHGAIVVIDEFEHFGLEQFDRHKGAALKQFAHQNAQPYLDLVQPGAMLGRVVKDDAMGGVTQEGGPTLAVFQDAGLAFDTQIDVQVRLLGDPLHQGS